MLHDANGAYSSVFPLIYAQRHSVAITCAQITTIPMNSVSEASAAASAISERIMSSSLNKEGT